MRGAFARGCAPRKIVRSLPQMTQKNGMTSRELCMDLLKKTGVVTVSGSGFGDCGEGYIRITYVTSDENIKRGFERIQSFVGGLGL